MNIYLGVILYIVGDDVKRLNFNIKDRKVLILVLCLVLVCVFTLTIAYAALNAVLTIQGSAQVTSADWDIHLANPKVTNGSATTNVPQIKTNSTMNFATTLNMPGDFYEFTVDVVNSGSIDAMIESVIKNPELDASQKKYLNYEVTYQNGESITTKQTLSKGTTMPIKVRIEYRRDLSASDLPTGQVALDLSLTLEYIQSDGTGTSVPNNGVGGSNISANGSLDAIGTIVTIGDQQFYTIGTEGDNVKLLSMYNLYVGNSVDSDWNVTTLASPTGKQSELARGWVDGADEWYGTTAFSSDIQKGTNYSDYSGSIVEGYVNNYKTILESEYGVDVVEARLITKDELISEKIGCSDTNYTCTGSAYQWIYSTSYWSGSANNAGLVWNMTSGGLFIDDDYSIGHCFGVRPVIVIDRGLIDGTGSSTTKQLIEFTIDGDIYQAEEGMTWAEWVDSEYNILSLSIGTNNYVNGEGLYSLRRSGLYVYGYDEIDETISYYLSNSAGVIN